MNTRKALAASVMETTPDLMFTLKQAIDDAMDVNGLGEGALASALAYHGLQVRFVENPDSPAVIVRDVVGKINDALAKGR